MATINPKGTNTSIKPVEPRLPINPVTPLGSGLPSDPAEHQSSEPESDNVDVQDTIEKLTEQELTDPEIVEEKTPEEQKIEVPKMNVEEFQGYIAATDED